MQRRQPKKIQRVPNLAVAGSSETQKKKKLQIISIKLICENMRSLQICL